MDPRLPVRTLLAVRRSDPFPPWPSDRAKALRVVAVYRSALNVAGAGRFVTLADADIGGLPDGVLVRGVGDLRALPVRVGMEVRGSVDDLVIPAARLRVDLRTAERWCPILGVVTGDPWPGRAGLVRRIVRNHRPRSGFAEPSLWAVAAAPLETLRTAIRADDAVAAADAADRLIGLGSGLTPAGDDVLVGAEAALCAVGHPLAGAIVGAIDDLDGRTTDVAAAMLRHAALGAFAERIHVLVKTLVQADVDGLPAAIREAADWGATSGVDTLIGATLALDAAHASPVRQRAA